MKFPKFRTGNVVKTKYDIIIITNVGSGQTRPDDDYYSWISFSSSNCSGGTYFKTIESEETCWDCCGHKCNDEECEDCNGIGKFIKIDYGLDCATLLGDNVKDYIVKKLTSNFEF